MVIKNLNRITVFLFLLFIIPIVFGETNERDYNTLYGDGGRANVQLDESLQPSLIVVPEAGILANGGYNLTGWWYATNWMDWIKEYTVEETIASWGSTHDTKDITTYYEGIKPSKNWELYVWQEGNTFYGEDEIMRLDGTIEGDTVTFRGVWKVGGQFQSPDCLYNDSDEIEEFEGIITKEDGWYVYIIRGDVSGWREWKDYCHYEDDFGYWEDDYKTITDTWEGFFAAGVNPLTVDFLDAEDWNRKVIGAAADGASDVVVRIRGLPPEVVNPNQVLVLVGLESGELLDDAWIEGDMFTQTWRAPEDFGGGNPDDGRREIFFYAEIDGKSIDVPKFYLYKPPLLLLHGLWAKETTWTPTEDYFINNYFGGNDLLINIVRYPSDIHFSDNIAGIGRFPEFAIEHAEKQDNDNEIVVKKVDIIAHSMGGILSNYYAGSGFYNDDVNRIITVGTPHSGSELANFALHFVFGEMNALERFHFLNINLIYKAFKWKMGSFTRGGIEDLQIGSPAIRDYREACLRANVPVYAVECPHSFDSPSLSLDLVYGGKYLGMGFYYWDHYLNPFETYFDGAGSPLWSLLYDPLNVEEGLFGDRDSSDFVVSLISQRGGSSAVREASAIDHISESVSDAVQSALIEILNKDVSEYDEDGFAPPFLAVPSVGVYDISESSATLEIFGEIESNGLSITSPFNGTSFSPGEDITVRASYEGKPDFGVFFLSQDGSYGSDNLTPYEFQFRVDEEFLGPMFIGAWIVNENGSIEQDSVEVQIVTNETPQQIKTYPSGPLYLESGDEFMLAVYGVYGNISRDITHLTSTVYTSSNTSVVVINNSGTIIAKASGEAIINITNEITTQLKVYVLESCEEPQDGMMVRKSMQFCPGTYFLLNGLEIDMNSGEIDCNGAIIEGNYSGYGIYIENQREVVIKNCTLRNYDRGIVLNQSYNSEIVMNKLYSNDFGIYLFESDGNSIVNNDVSNNAYHGVFTESSSNVDISSNVMDGNGLSGDYGYGIYVRYGSGANIMDNSISNNSGVTYAYGMKIRQNPNVLIENNVIATNKDNAVQIEYSDNVTIKENNIISNRGGIYIDSSDNNRIFHNNIIDNIVQAFDNGSNYWDNGVIEGGNYWSDYDEVNEGCNDVDGNGYCDLAYFISTNGVDNYPFNEQDGWGGEVFYLNLSPGWNLFSIPLNLSNNSVSYLFDELVYGYNGSWFFAEEINNKLGYWIKVDAPMNIAIDGTEIENKTINLLKGWNLIGYPLLYTSPISETLKEINLSTVYSYKDNKWYSYVKGRNDSLNSLKNLIPGYGYLVYSNNATNLILTNQ